MAQFGEKIRHFFVLSVGSISALIISILFQPVITRVYSPEEIGLFALIMAIVTVFGGSIHGAYEQSIVTTSDDTEANILMVGSIYIGFLACGLIVFGMALVLYVVPNSLDAGWWSILAVPIMFGNGIQNVFVNYNNRIKNYKAISLATTSKQLLGSGGQVILGMFGAGVAGIAASHMLATTVAIYCNVKGRAGLGDFSKYDFDTIWPVLIKFKRQPLYAASASFVASLAYALIVFFVNSLYGLTALGMFSLAFNIMMLPIAVIAHNVHKVYLQRAASTYSLTGKFDREFIQASTVLAAMSVVIYGGVWFFAENVVGPVFGAAWGGAGPLMAALTPFFAIRFVVTVVSGFLIISQRQRTQLFVQIGLAISSVAAFAIASHFQLALLDFISLLSLLYGGNYAVLFLYSWRASIGR